MIWFSLLIMSIGAMLATQLLLDLSLSSSVFGVFVGGLFLIYRGYKRGVKGAEYGITRMRQAI